MARNDDRAKARRAKRGGDDTPADEAAESLTPGASEGEQPDVETDEIVADATEESELTESQRAEIATRAGIVGAPIDLAPPSDITPLTDFDPAPGGVTVGGEVTTGGGGPRILRFFKASWAELKRVRWPDRQQVAQGTAVTLGFVVVAGAFLGVADLVARQIVNLIL